MTKIKIDAEFAKTILTVEEALDLLAPHLEGRKKRVHTFEGMAFGLMGCDMDLTSVKATLKKCECDEIALSGVNMRRMGHGVAFFVKGRGWTFLETDSKKIDSIHKTRRLK
jgi:hypothetical protein